jgi:hypothetical protein
VNDAREAGDLLMRSLLRAQELVRSFKQVAVDQSSESVAPLNSVKCFTKSPSPSGPC